MFVELHARSAFSFLEGASLPEDLAAGCAELGMTAMAVVDRNGVYGSPRFHLAAKKVGVKAHIGAELNVSRLPDLRETRNVKRETSLPLLVESREGYQNLCRLITRMKLRVPKHARPGECAASFEELEQYSKGLVCLTGGDDGILARALEQGGCDQAKRTVERLAAIFGRENVYVELQRHFLREEESRNRAAAEIADLLGLPIVATNGVAYAVPQKRELLDVFTCIKNHRMLDTAGRLLERNGERHLKTPQQMAGLFADLPQAIAHAAALSSRLDFTLADLGYEFPKYPVSEGETMMSFLRQRTAEGAQERYGRARHPRPAADRARTAPDREARPRRIFPDRVGYCALLPEAEHPGAGTRLGGELGGLLFAGDHGSGPDRDGPAIRTLPLGGARRVARHRPRPAHGGAARARHPIRLRALRQAGCGDDRERHHLPRTLGGARGG